MKQLLMLLMLTTLSAPVLAQSQTKAQSISMMDSGSGNGSLNRDLLDYETDIKETQENLRSLEEAFTKLIQDIRNLSNAKTPTFQGPGDEFWDKLTENDRQNILAYDQYLISSVEAVIARIEATKKTVLAEQATIDALARDAYQYEDRGMKKQFKQRVSSKKERLATSLKNSMFEVLDSLFLITGKVLNHPFYDFSVTNDYRLEKCDSALCVDIIGKKMKSFFDVSMEITEMHIKLVGVNGSLKKIYNGTKYTPVRVIKKEGTAGIKEAIFQALASIHEKEIRNQNH